MYLYQVQIICMMGKSEILFVVQIICMMGKSEILFVENRYLYICYIFFALFDWKIDIRYRFHTSTYCLYDGKRIYEDFISEMSGNITIRTIFYSSGVLIVEIMYFIQVRMVMMGQIIYCIHIVCRPPREASGTADPRRRRTRGRRTRWRSPWRRGRARPGPSWRPGCAAGGLRVRRTPAAIAGAF